MIRYTAEERAQKNAVRRMDRSKRKAERAARPPRIDADRLPEIEEPDMDERRAMTPARKRRIWEREHGICWLCTKPVPMEGPEVIYDHRNVLRISGSDDDGDIFPIHTEPCNRLKTAADKARIAKTNRQSKLTRPREKSRRPLRSRGFL